MRQACVKLLSVNVAKVGRLFIGPSRNTPRIATAIHKQPVSGPVIVGKLGLAGDEQADLSIHGGLHKAVYAYPAEHYPFWRVQRLAVLKRDDPLPFGSMGENLTIEGLPETDVWIGDRVQVGATLLEVTEPRPPCFKLAAKMGFSHALKMMVQSGYTGFYLRVLKTGTVQTGDNLTLIPGPRQVSVAMVNARRWKGCQQDVF